MGKTIVSITRNTEVKDLRNIVGLEKDQNDNLKLHFKAMDNLPLNEEQRLAVGDWDNFSSYFVHPKKAEAYIEQLRGLGIVSNKADYYKQFYVPRKETFVGIESDSVIKEYNFKNTFTREDEDGNKQNLGLVRINNDTTDVITDKGILNSVKNLYDQPDDIPLFFLLDQGMKLNKSNPLISNYENIVNGRGLTKPGMTDLEHPLAFDADEIISSQVDPVELAVYKVMLEDGYDISLENIQNNSEDFKKTLADNYYNTQLTSDYRFDTEIEDIDLENLNKELETSLVDWVQNSAYNPKQKSILLNFIQENILVSQINDFGPYWSTDMDTIKKHYINGFYDQSLVNIFDENHQLNQIYFPIDTNGDQIFNQEDLQVSVDHMNAIKLLAENSDTEHLVPDYYYNKDGNIKDITRHPEYKYYLADLEEGKQTYLTSQAFKDDETGAKASGVASKIIVRTDQDLEDFKSNTYIDSAHLKDIDILEQQDLLQLFKQDTNLVGMLKKIYEKYEGSKSKDNYNQNVKNMIKNESSLWADNQHKKIENELLKFSYISEGYKLVDADTKQVEKKASLQDNLARYTELAHYRFQMDILNEHIKAREDRFSPGIVEGLYDMGGYATMHLSDAAVELLPESARNFFAGASDIRDLHKALTQEYPHYKTWVKANQSSLAAYGDWLYDLGGPTTGNLFGFMKFMKYAGVKGNPLMPGFGSKLSLKTRQAIRSGSIFSAHTAISSTFNPDVPIGFSKERNETGFSDYAWNDTIESYSRKIIPSAVTSFTLGLLFPHLGNAHGNINTMGMNQLNKLDVMETAKAAATFLVQVGYLGSANSGAAFVDQVAINHARQFEPDYEGEEITIKDAMEMSLEQLLSDGEGNFDGSFLSEQFMFMMFLHGTGNIKRFDYRMDKKALKKAYDDLPDFIATDKGMAQVPKGSINQNVYRNNYVNFKKYEMLGKWAEDIIKNHEIPSFVKKGYKGTPQENQAIYNWYKDFYQKPDFLFGKIQEALSKFEGKKIWMPVEDKNTGRIILMELDYGKQPTSSKPGVTTPKSMTRFQYALKDLKNRYEKVYNAHRADPSKVDVNAMQEAYDEVMDIYLRSEFMHANPQGIPDIGPRSTSTYRVIKLDDGRKVLYDPLTGFQNYLPKDFKISGRSEFGGIGDKIE